MYMILNITYKYIKRDQIKKIKSDCQNNEFDRTILF